MKSEIESKLSSLIKDPNLERLELDLKSPNLFSVLKLEKYEIRHSNFLSWLLNPKESHNLSDLFLKWFLKDIFSDEKVDWINEFYVDSLDMRKIQVYREWKNIDILIESEEFVVCIENKVDSNEHSNQLSRYKEIVYKNFPHKKKAFVFLSPYATVPVNEINKEIFVIYSYAEIKKNVETVLDVYVNSIPDKVKHYLEDYLKILRRDIMKEHESIELARIIYSNHKEALDFIFENKPDRLSDISPIIRKVVEEYGYKLGTVNKGYIRFLTTELHKVIPKSGNGWSGKESFLFEIDFWPKKVTFRTVISPGNEQNRQILERALSRLEGARKPSGKIWLVHFNESRKVDLTSEKFEDDSVIEELMKDLLDEQSTLINAVEAEILKEANYLRV
ncbi:MAG: PD-(D/E)XK nuclease family protein [Clostridia bacterium]|nr:PD-(D/E)XK nuclease family protein [Clostridia bacterium]